MGGVFEQPSRRDLVQAVALAALCSLLFLGAGILPTRSVVPFVPEVYEPARSEALRDGTVSDADLRAGAPSMGDKYNQSLAWDRIIQDRFRAGELPLWTRDIAGGAPFVPQMAQVYQPWNLLLLLPIPSAGIYGLWFFLHQVLFGLLAWWFLRKIGLAHHAALLGLVCAVLGLWMQARIHHNVIVSAALPLFALLSLVHHSIHVRAGPGRTAAIALGIGVSWSGGFAPVSLQVTYLTVAYALLCAFETRRWRSLATVGLAIGLGGVLSLAQMGPTLVAAAHTSRGTATTSLLIENGASWAHAMTTIWPDLLNWPTRSVPTWAALDWLPPGTARKCNYPETAFAVGLPGLLLALAALRRPSARTVFFGVCAVVGFGLATASTPFLELSALLPGARAGDLKRFLFLTAMSLPVLAALGAQHLALLERDRGLTAIAAAISAASVIAFLGYVSLDDIEAICAHFAERLSGDYGGQILTAEDILPSLLAERDDALANCEMLAWTHGHTAVVALGCGAVFWFVTRCWRLPALIALTMLQLLAVGHGTIVPVPVERVTTPPHILEPVIAASRDVANGVRPRLHRLVESTAPKASEPLPPNLGAYHRVEDLCAYNPLPPAAMEELFLAIEPDATPSPAGSKTSVVIGGGGVGGFRDPRSLQHPLLDLLGVRFVISSRDDVESGPDLVDRTPASTPAPYRLLERTSTWPRATFVDRAAWIPDRRERLRILGDPSHDARHLTVFSASRQEMESAIGTPVPDGDGVTHAAVEILEHRDEVVRVRVSNSEPGWLRLADPFDPGWTATVDGESRPVWVADHYFRAVLLDAAGEHVVEFRYDDALIVRTPRWLSGAALLVVLALGLLEWRWANSDGRRGR